MYYLFNRETRAFNVNELHPNLIPEIYDYQVMYLYHNNNS